MEVSVTDAKARLTDLVKRAEGGEEVVLTRHGHAAVRLTPVRRVLTPEERGAVIDRAQASARVHMIPGPSSAELQEALYDENGLPA